MSFQCRVAFRIHYSLISYPKFQILKWSEDTCITLVSMSHEMFSYQRYMFIIENDYDETERKVSN